jgi:hypothetical protein
MLLALGPYYIHSATIGFLDHIQSTNIEGPNPGEPEGPHYIKLSNLNNEVIIFWFPSRFISWSNPNIYSIKYCLYIFNNHPFQCQIQLRFHGLNSQSELGKMNMWNALLFFCCVLCKAYVQPLNSIFSNEIC